jgi:hypothetical protein
MTGADQGKLSFGNKLAYLIETVHPPDRVSTATARSPQGSPSTPGR